MRRTPLISLVLHLLLACPVIAQMTGHTSVAYDTDNTVTGVGAFTNKNQFMLGVTLGPITFSALSTISNTTTTIFISDGTLGSSPCTGGGTGALAIYIAGAWNCNAGTAGGGGGGNVTTTPVASQPVIQPVGTQFSTNIFANIRYVTPSFNWLQSPGADLSSPGSKTVTLVPCPSGVTGTDPNLWVYVSAQGTPEADVITGGSCTPGAVSGTITFTTVNAHAAGYTVGSATAGAYEALRDATPTNNNNVRLIFPPTNPPASVYYTLYAPVTVLGGMIEIDGNGATIDCQARRACFVIPTQNAGSVRIHGFRAGSRTTYSATAITQTACAANVATITSTMNPAVNEYVDVQGTFNNHFWGVHKVATTSGSSWTYADTNCGGAGSYSAQTTVGGNAYEWAFVETNTSGTHISDIDLNAPGGFSPPFNSFVVVLNDQSFGIDHIQVGGMAGCTSNYCSNFVYAPGPFSLNASVIYAGQINGTLNCTGNGFTLYSGNTAQLDDVVIQGFTQWSLATGPLRGGFGPTTLTNVYNEVGGCANPLYPGTGLQQKAMAGVISWGGRLSIRGGEAPIGNLPLFANTGNGNTQYNYYLIVKDTGGSNFGPSAPLYCGQAKVDSVTPSGSITVACPRINGPIGADVITYDILRVAGVGNNLIQPNGGNCGGGSTTACGSIITGQTQCATAICSFTDNAASNTTAYVVPATTYWPYVTFWPGAMALLSGGDTNNIIAAASAKASVDDLNFITNVSPIVSEVQSVPMIYSPACVVSTPGVWVSCLGGDSVGNNNKLVVGTLLQNGPASGSGTVNLKGRLNFIVPGSLTTPNHIITLVDSAPAKSIASPFFRPTNDANDTSICLDGGSSLAAAQLCFTSPIATSFYIGNVGDGTSWLERLTATLKSFTVPLSVAGTVQATSTVFTSLPPCAGGTEGSMRAITDSTTNTWGATITGSGANHVLAYCNGSAWTVMAK